MKQPDKPGWKRWLLATVAACGIAGGFGSGMMTNDRPVTAPPDLGNQMQSTSVFSTSVDPFGVAGVFNKQADYGQLRLASDAMDAAVLDDLAALERAVGSGYDLKANNQDLLRTAVTFESYNVTKYLLAGQDGGAIARGDAIESAAMLGRIGMVQLLTEKGADVNVNNSGPLFWAVLGGQSDTAQYLINHGARVTSDMLDLHSAVIDPVMLNLLQQGAAQQAGNGGNSLGTPFAPPPPAPPPPGT